MRLRILFLLLIAIASNVYAQDDMIGVGVSYASDLYKFDDPRGAIRSVPLPNPEVSIYWKRAFENDLFTQFGVSTKSYWEGFTYNGASSYITSPAFTAIKLNSDVGYRLKLIKKLFVVPRAGISIAMNTATHIGTGLISETTHANGATIQSTYQESGDVNRFFVLGHGAIGLEYDLFSTFVISIHAGYHTGFMKANVLNAQYTIDQSPTYYATVTSRGDYRDFGIGLAYKIRQR